MNYLEYCARQKSLNLYVESEDRYTKPVIIQVNRIRLIMNLLNLENLQTSN